jgi:NAD(P)-dependent dehydrogenase (short-subunit alcohol dehydrogenase family)
MLWGRTGSSRVSASQCWPDAGGSIINVLSGSGFLPTPHATPYGATKSALWMMTRYMSQELAPKIRVNALIPGLAMSDTGGPHEGPVTEYITTLVPMGRAGHPREVAPAAVYLASDASSYTNGTARFVNRRAAVVMDSASRQQSTMGSA